MRWTFLRCCQLKDSQSVTKAFWRSQIRLFSEIKDEFFLSYLILSYGLISNGLFKVSIQWGSYEMLPRFQKKTIKNLPKRWQKLFLASAPALAALRAQGATQTAQAAEAQWSHGATWREKRVIRGMRLRRFMHINVNVLYLKKEKPGFDRFYYTVYALKVIVGSVVQPNKYKTMQGNSLEIDCTARG